MKPNYFADKELNKLPCGVVVFENHAPWKILHANELYYKEFSNDNLNTINIYEEDLPSLNSLAPRLAHGEASANLLYRAYNKQGEDKRIVMSASRYGDNAFLGVLWDATDRAKMIEEVEHEKEKFAMALCNSKNVVFEHNLKKGMQVFYIPNTTNNTVETIKKQCENLTIPVDAIHPNYRDFFLANILNPKEKMLAAKLKLPNDIDYKWYRVTRQFEFENGEMVRIFGVMVDIDDEKKQEAERRREAELDPTLKIYYRNAAVKKIESYLKNNPDRRDYALYVMDIDNFKNINDSFGHLYGDTVIEMVAHVLKDINPEFSIPGRYGGDEFFIFVYSANINEIKDIADKILMKMLEVKLPDGGRVTSSIGIVPGELFIDEPQYKLMFEKADKALYAAKKNGKAQYQIYNSDMDESSGRAIDYEIDDENSSELMESKDLMKVFLELSSAAKSSEAAIYSIIKYITAKFDFDWMQVMQVNSKDDLITIRYEWSRDSEFHNNAGKSGYYVHSDIMKFRHYFEKNPIFDVTPENTKGFSLKFQREFDKNKDYNIIYISDTTADDNFYMFTCIRFDKSNSWTEEELEGLNVASKIMTMFIAQSGKESEREKELQKELDFDKKTGLYNIDRFYVQLGRLRKLAVENDDDIMIFHIDFGNMVDFNLKFGYRAGDDMLSEFGRLLRLGSNDERSIAMHINGTDMFYCAFRIKKGDKKIARKYEKEFKLFCERMNNERPGAKLVLRTGVYIIPNGEDGGTGFDKAFLAKKNVKDRDRTFFKWYDGEFELHK